MNVVFTNGNKGIITEEASKKLFIQGRFSKESWCELQEEMKRLGIEKFQDPFLSQLGVEYPADFVSLEYVHNRIAAY